MQYRKLGNTGLKVSAIGLGTNRFGSKVDENGVAEIMQVAMEHGINFFDTANVYTDGNSEKLIGKALKSLPRSEVILATKFYMKVGEAPNDRGGSRKHIMDAVENSLRSLQTDYIDLYQYHRWDQDTPIEETLRAMDDLVTSGKVRYIGSSAFPSWMMATAQKVSQAHGWNQFVTEQPHFHMLERKVKEEVLPAAAYFGIGILPFFPLAGGFLTGKYKRGEAAPVGSRGEDSSYVQRYMTDGNYDLLEKLTAFAEERDHTMGELAHAWLLAHPQVSSVISGATRLEHVIANAKAGDWQLSEAEFSEVNEILEK